MKCPLCYCHSFEYTNKFTTTQRRLLRWQTDYAQNIGTGNKLQDVIGCDYVGTLLQHNVLQIDTATLHCRCLWNGCRREFLCYHVELTERRTNRCVN